MMPESFELRVVRSCSWTISRSFETQFSSFLMCYCAKHGPLHRGTPSHSWDIHVVLLALQILHHNCRTYYDPGIIWEKCLFWLENLVPRSADLAGLRCFLVNSASIILYWCETFFRHILTPFCSPWSHKSNSFVHAPSEACHLCSPPLSRDQKL